MDSLGEQLRQLRLESGWSKRTLAGMLGVSIPSIIRWEAQIAEPNDYNRYKIEQFLSRFKAAGQQSTSTHRTGVGQLDLFSDREGSRQIR